MVTKRGTSISWSLPFFSIISISVISFSQYQMIDDWRNLLQVICVCVSHSFKRNAYRSRVIVTRAPTMKRKRGKKRNNIIKGFLDKWISLISYIFFNRFWLRFSCTNIILSSTKINESHTSLAHFRLFIVDFLLIVFQMVSWIARLWIY